MVRAKQGSIGGLDAAGLSGTCEAPPLPAQRRDQLAYMADLIAELREMARQAECDTLSGLLDLAHREALLQRNGKGQR